MNACIHAYSTAETGFLESTDLSLNQKLKWNPRHKKGQLVTQSFKCHYTAAQSNNVQMLSISSWKNFKKRKWKRLASFPPGDKMHFPEKRTKPNQTKTNKQKNRFSESDDRIFGQKLIRFKCFQRNLNITFGFLQLTWNLIFN